MKYKVKFRVTREDGKKQKYAINMEEGATFSIGNDTLGAELRKGSDSKTFCALTVRDATVFVSNTGYPGGIKLNNKPGEEFDLKIGDFVQVGDYSIEFLEIPVAVAKPAATQFLDISEMMSTAKPAKASGTVGNPKSGSKKKDKAARRQEYLDRERQKHAESLSKKEEKSSPELDSAAMSHLDESQAGVGLELEKPQPAESSLGTMASETRIAAMNATEEAPPASSYNEAGNGGGEHTLMSVARPESRKPAQRTTAESSESMDAVERPRRTSSSSQRQTTARTEKTRAMPGENVWGHVGISFAMLALGGGIIGQIIARYEGGSNHMGFLYGAGGGAVGAALVAAVLHFTAEFFNIRAVFHQFYRYFAFFAIPTIVWSFSFAFPTSVQVFLSVLTGVLFFASFAVKFAPNMQRFFGVVGALGVVAGVASYAFLHGQKVAEQVAQVTNAAGQPEQRAPATTDAQAPAGTQEMTPPPGQTQAPTTPDAPAMAQPPVAQVPPPAQVTPPVQAQAPAQPPVAQVAPPLQVTPPVQAQAQVQPPKSTGQDSFAVEEFFSAVKSGNLAVVRTLVEKRAVDPDFTLDHGNTALMYASANGQTSVVRYLLSKHVNLNAQDPNGTTALMWAAYKNHKDVVQLLVQRGADMTIKREDGDRAIDVARRWGNTDVVKLLKILQDRAIASQPSKYHK